MKKRVLSALLVFLLVLSSAAPVYAAQNDYDNHWAEDTIGHWLEKGLISGYGEGVFKPDNKVTRAEFVKMVNYAFGFSEKASISFSDVNEKDWFYAEVQKAVAAGYINGVSAAQFAPNADLSREQAASMLSRIKGLEANEAALDVFTDKASVSNWAKGTVGAAVKAGYIKGSDGKFNPLDFTKRAEAVTMLDRVVNPVIAKAGTTVKGETFQSITIDAAVKNGEVTLDNVTVLDELIVKGGGENSIILNNSKINNLLVNKADGKVRIFAKGTTTVNNTFAESGVILAQEDMTAKIFDKAKILSGVDAAHTVTVRANIADLTIIGKADVKIMAGTVEKLTVLETAANSLIHLAKDAVIESAVINAKASFTGQGAIKEATINADGVNFEKAPEAITVADGVKQPTIGAAPGGGGGGTGDGGGGVVTPDPTPNITDIAISPVTITTTSSAIQFTAVPTGTAIGTPTVSWSVTGSGITGSGITLDMNSTSGALTFGGVTTSTAITTGASITVTATATSGSSTKSVSVVYDLNIANGAITITKRSQN